MDWLSIAVIVALALFMLGAAGLIWVMITNRH